MSVGYIHPTPSASARVLKGPAADKDKAESSELGTLPAGQDVANSCMPKIESSMLSTIEFMSRLQLKLTRLVESGKKKKKKIEKDQIAREKGKRNETKSCRTQ